MGTFGVKRASDEYFCPSTVPFVWEIHVRVEVSLGVSEKVKFVAKHTKLSDLLRIFNLARTLSHLSGEKVKNHIF